MPRLVVEYYIHADEKLLIILLWDVNESPYLGSTIYNMKKWKVARKPKSSHEARLASCPCRTPRYVSTRHAYSVRFYMAVRPGPHTYAKNIDLTPPTCVARGISWASNCKTMCPTTTFSHMLELSPYFLLNQRHLRWLGHVRRLEDGRILLQVQHESM